MSVKCIYGIIQICFLIDSLDIYPSLRGGIKVPNYYCVTVISRFSSASFYFTYLGAPMLAHKYL